MLRAAGFRATPSAVYLAIISKGEHSIILDGVTEIKLPDALNFPEKLLYLRNTVLDIINEYEVSLAGIKLTEYGPSLNTERANIEGVLQELIASSKVQKYVAGQIAKLTGILQVDRTFFNSWKDGSQPLPFNVLDWPKYCSEEKEAIITAFTATRLNK